MHFYVEIVGLMADDRLNIVLVLCYHPSGYPNRAAISADPLSDLAEILRRMQPSSFALVWDPHRESHPRG